MKNKKKAADALARRAIRRSGGKQHSRGVNMASAVKKIKKVKKGDKK
jgi:hypothetical protein